MITEAQRPAAGGSGEMFDAIAGRYDLLNRVLSLGIDQGWRRQAVASLGLAGGGKVLDLATGTADLAIQLAQQHPALQVLGVDPSAGMLAVGQRKIEAAGLTGRVELRRGDAQHLELESASIDAVTMAFGIRNVPDRPQALREIARVLRPGGRVAILELSEPRGGLLGPMARLHVRRVVPWIGALLSGAREYRYLQQSIAAFPPPEEFVALMASCGLSEAAARPLTFGACCLYTATVS